MVCVYTRCVSPYRIKFDSIIITNANNTLHQREKALLLSVGLCLAYSLNVNSTGRPRLVVTQQKQLLKSKIFSQNMMDAQQTAAGVASAYVWPTEEKSSSR